MLAGVCRRLSLSVTLRGVPEAGGFIRAGQAMTSCLLKSNYSSTVTLHGGPVVLRFVRATPCYTQNVSTVSSISLFLFCVHDKELSGVNKRKTAVNS